MYDRDYKNQLNWTLVPVGPGVAPPAAPDAPAPVAPLPSGGRQRGFEPYDPLAVASYNALLAAGDIDTKYLTCTAKSGVVIVAGSVLDAPQKRHAEEIVRAVPGVAEVRSELRVVGK